MKISRTASVFLLAVVLAGMLFATEGAVRQWMPQQLVRHYNIPDRDLGITIAPNQNYHDRYGNNYWIKTNSLGFRMAEEPDMDPARRRILVYGDSFTFGFGVNYEHSYFAGLKRTVERQIKSLQLLNASAPGYSSGHVKLQMERHIPVLKPSAIIYFFNNNDVFDNAITDPDYRVTTYRFRTDGSVELRDQAPFAPWKRFLLNETPYGWLNQHSHLYVLAKGALKQLLDWKKSVRVLTLNEDGAARKEARAASKTNPAPVAGQQPAYTVTPAMVRSASGKSKQLLAISRAHVRRVLGLAQRNDLPILLVWVLHPLEEIHDGRRNPTIRLLGEARDMLRRETARWPDARFIDTVALVPRGEQWMKRRKTLRFVTDLHFNVAGNRWFADLVMGGVTDFLKNLPTADG